MVGTHGDQNQSSPSFHYNLTSQVGLGVAYHRAVAALAENLGGDAVRVSCAPETLRARWSVSCHTGWTSALWPLGTPKCLQKWTSAASPLNSTLRFNGHTTPLYKAPTLPGPEKPGSHGAMAAWAANS